MKEHFSAVHMRIVWSVLIITKLQPLIPTAAIQIAVPFHVQGFIIQSASVEGEAFEKRARMKREPSVKFKWAGLELRSMQQNYLLCARTLLCLKLAGGEAGGRSPAP